jgi:hypothetical protein
LTKVRFDVERGVDNYHGELLTARKLDTAKKVSNISAAGDSPGYVSIMPFQTLLALSLASSPGTQSVHRAGES